MEIKINNVCSKNLIDINISFAKNKITSLIGKNVIEKKELIDLICGIEEVNGGTITYEEINNKKNANISSIYHLKENSKNMLFNITIKEDIKFYLDEYNEEKLYELLKSFNLDNSILENNYLELSSSETRKILLIIGLMSKTKIIILENPTSKLDNKSIQSLIKNLKKLKRENKVIIISSYNTDFLLEVSDKIVVLHNKKIIEEGNKFDVLSNAKLLNKINLKTPNILEFINKVRDLKKIKIGYRDNINDLIKDIFRYAK